MFKEIRSTSQNEWGYVIIWIYMIDYVTRSWKKSMRESFLNFQALHACLQVTFLQMFAECDTMK